MRSLLLVLAITACSDPPPAKSPQKGESVPANSLSDARMKGEEDPKDRADREAAKKNDSDPTKPYTTKIGEAPERPTSTTGTTSDKKTSTAAAGKVSQTECDHVMDKYLDLEIATNPQLKGVPPEVIESAKQMAREKHGDMPCTATRAQYTCAMAASSSAAWQKCMK